MLRVREDFYIQGCKCKEFSVHTMYVVCAKLTGFVHTAARMLTPLRP